jgi:hypothetical protein
MSKKNFSGGLDSLLGDQPDKPKVGRPRTNFKEVTKASEEGTKAGETRATFILKQDTLDKLKAMAYWERLLIKDVVTGAIDEAITKYEKKHGEVKPIPKK